MKELNNHLAIPPLYGQVPGSPRPPTGPQSFGSYRPAPKAKGKIRRSGGLWSTSGKGGGLGDGSTAVLQYGPAPVVAATYSGPSEEQVGAALQTGSAAAVSAASLVGGAAAAGVFGGPAGWVVAGGLLTAALVLKLTDVFRKRGVQAARAEVAALGYGDDFVKEYVRLANAKQKKIEARIEALTRDVSREQAQVNARKKKGKAPKQKDVKQLARAVDRLNAAKMVLLGRIEAPEQPVIAGQPLTAAPSVESRGIVGDALDEVTSNPLPYLGGMAAAVALAFGTGWVVRRRRAR